MRQRSLTILIVSCAPRFFPHTGENHHEKAGTRCFWQVTLRFHIAKLPAGLFRQAQACNT